MTTTNTFIGLGTDNKPSSKVLKPPGGGSHDIFGTGTANHLAEPQHKTNKKHFNSTVFDTPCGDSIPAETIKGRGGGGFNPITGEANESKCEDMHCGVRVRNPPGGPSTKLW